MDAFERFVKLVTDMRNAQREFFRTKSGAALEQSKRLEKLVDKAIAELADKQPKLFA